MPRMVPSTRTLAASLATAYALCRKDLAAARARRAEERAHVASLLDAMLPVGARRLGLLDDAEVTTPIERPSFEKSTAPTLAIGVADDFYGTYDAARCAAKEIRGARFVGLPEVGHVLVGIDRKVTEAIAEFLHHAGRQLAGG